MSEDERNRDYFIQEQIRKKPFYKRREFQKILYGVTLTTVFGAIAGAVFAVIHPWALNYFGEPGKIVLVGKDKESETAGSSAAMLFEESTGEEKKLSPEKYEQLYEETINMTKENRKAIVTVKGVVSEENLVNGINENSRISTGVIIGSTDTAVLILTGNRVLQEAASVKVTFCDGTTANAGVQKADEITDMAVLKVPTRNLDDRTAELVEPVTFGEAVNVDIGDPIIAVGADYISFGMVTDRPYLYFCDGSYRLINTDIIGCSENGGALLNLAGQFVGILGPVSGSQDSSTMLSGVGISEIGNLLNALSGRGAIPYLGITGRDVTDTLMKELSMPHGVVVTRVKEGSPAMEKGIQATDVISEINGLVIKNVKDYMEVLHTLNPGDSVSVSLWRKGKGAYRKTKVNITIGER